MQRLMLRAIACIPEGAAAFNPLCLVGCWGEDQVGRAGGVWDDGAPVPLPPGLHGPAPLQTSRPHAPLRPCQTPDAPSPAPRRPQTSAGWVLRESKAVYRAASEGVINLADKFFEMDRANAMKCVAGAGQPLGLPQGRSSCCLAARPAPRPQAFGADSLGEGRPEAQPPPPPPHSFGPNDSPTSPLQLLNCFETPLCPLNFPRPPGALTCTRTPSPCTSASPHTTPRCRRCPRSSEHGALGTAAQTACQSGPRACPRPACHWRPRPPPPPPTCACPAPAPGPPPPPQDRHQLPLAHAAARGLCGHHGAVHKGGATGGRAAKEGAPGRQRAGPVPKAARSLAQGRRARPLRGRPRGPPGGLRCSVRAPKASSPPSTFIKHQLPHRTAPPAPRAPAAGARAHARARGCRGRTRRGGGGRTRGARAGRAGARAAVPRDGRDARQGGADAGDRPAVFRGRARAGCVGRWVRGRERSAGAAAARWGRRLALGTWAGRGATHARDWRLTLQRPRTIPAALQRPRSRPRPRPRPRATSTPWLTAWLRPSSSSSSSRPTASSPAPLTRPSSSSSLAASPRGATPAATPAATGVTRVTPPK
jgi:hypothetical protein